MFYNKKYVLSDYLSYQDMNELIEKEKELINGISMKQVKDDEYVYVNGEETETGSDYSLLGETEQDGTPTPDSPVEVETVTGRQDINVVGKNLFDKDNVINGKRLDSSGLPSINDSGCCTTNYFIKVKPNTTYYSTQPINGTRCVCCYDKDKNHLTRLMYLNVNTFTTVANTEYIKVSLYKENINDEQIEQGTQATYYEEYIGQSFELNLGKNLLDIQTNMNLNTGSGLVLTYNSDGSFTMSGTTTRTYGYVTSYYNVNIPPGTYTFSIKEALTHRIYLNVTFDDNTTGTFTITVGNTSQTNTTTKTIKRMQLAVSNMTNSTSYDETIYPMLEKGSQATSYSSYKTPIELCKIGNYRDRIYKSTGSQLFDVSTIQVKKYVGKSTGGIGSSDDWSATDYIEVKENTDYILSGIVNSYSGSAGTVFYNANKERISAINSNVYTFTTPSNAKYVRISLNSETPTNVMFNEGTVALPYEPYNSKDKWLLHKEIGKVVLNGSETWNRTQVSSSNSYAFWNLFTTLGLPKPKYNVNAPKICNYFPYEFKVWSQSTVNHLAENDATNLSLLFNVDNSIATTVTQWNNWLSTHNTIVYYVLATPTTTEITDTELIGQLESIWRTIKYWNYISILPMGNYDLDFFTYELNDFVYLEDIDKIERNIMKVGYDFFQPPRYIQNKIWRNWNETDVYKSLSYEDLNRIITDMNILWEHKDDTPSIYNVYTNENWDETTNLEWE